MCQVNNKKNCTIIDELLNVSHLSNVHVKTATFGTLNEFSGIDSDWSSYNERCTFYFNVNKITHDDIKRAVFLSIVGD